LWFAVWRCCQQSHPILIIIIIIIIPPASLSHLDGVLLFSRQIVLCFGLSGNLWPTKEGKEKNQRGTESWHTHFKVETSLKRFLFRTLHRSTCSSSGLSFFYFPAKQLKSWRPQKFLAAPSRRTF